MITLDLEICLEVDMLATGSAGGSPSEGQGPACEANTTVSQQPQDDESAELFLKVLPGAGEGVHSPHLSGNFADVAHHQAAPLGSG